MRGKVYLVGAGPGDTDLLTLKALRVLQTADVVLHDDLVPAEIVQCAPGAAQVHNVGKRCGKKKITQAEINSLMVGYAGAGLTVVRLKGGDPLIFGRVAEEIGALRAAGVDFEIIPGVTTALAAAAEAKIPLIDRRRASTLMFVSNHRCAARSSSGWQAAVSGDATLVIYMPGQDYGEIAAELIEAGLSAYTPCVVISRATTTGQQIYRTKLWKLSEAPLFPTPTLIIIGAVAEENRPTEEDSNRPESRGAACLAR